MAYNPNNLNGQALMSGSAPVVIASDQTPLPVYINEPGIGVWKSANYTTTQTGATIWTPTSTTYIGIKYLAISSYGTTAGRVIIWFGASADTTYTAGTDQLIWAGSFAPSTTSRPGAIISVPSLLISNVVDYQVKITTDAAISLDITIYGNELSGTF